MKYGFGVDLGGTTVKIAYFDTDGQLLHKWEIPTRSDNGGRQILPDIAEAINDFLTRNQIPNRDIIGIGIGVPGPIGSDGVVNRCVNLGWGMFNIEEALGALTGFPALGLIGGGCLILGLVSIIERNAKKAGGEVSDLKFKSDQLREKAANEMKKK